MGSADLHSFGVGRSIQFHHVHASFSASLRIAEDRLKRLCAVIVRSQRFTTTFGEIMSAFDMKKLSFDIASRARSHGRMITQLELVAGVALQGKRVAFVTRDQSVLQSSIKWLKEHYPSLSCVIPGGQENSLIHMVVFDVQKARDARLHKNKKRPD